VTEFLELRFEPFEAVELRLAQVGAATKPGDLVPVAVRDRSLELIQLETSIYRNWGEVEVHDGAQGRGGGRLRLIRRCGGRRFGVSRRIVR
jgi:hypothetical protein